MNHLLALTAGVCLDVILGDPHRFLHPVRFMGFLIKCFEKFFRKRCHTPRQLRFAGMAMLIVMVVLSGGAAFLALKLLFGIGFWYGFAGEALLSYWMLSGGCLAREAKSVARSLSKSVEAARSRIAMLVGRDTQQLGREGIIRATVETVAENTSDGIISPLFYLFLGGPVAGAVFKAVSTMDSMIGYMNEEFRDIGRAGAKADDVLNFIPARITGVIMVFAAAILRMDYKNAWKTLKRDHKNHKSPNCGWPESAAAGALRIRLGGAHRYFGETVYKPTIGDDLQSPKPEDIRSVNRLMYATYGLGFAFFAVVYTLVWTAAGRLLFGVSPFF